MTQGWVGFPSDIGCADPTLRFLASDFLPTCRRSRKQTVADTQSRRDYLKVAEDVTPGLELEEKGSPGGAAESIPLQPSLRDWPNCQGVFPGLTSWATFRSSLRDWTLEGKVALPFGVMAIMTTSMDAVHFSLSLPQASRDAQDDDFVV